MVVGATRATGDGDEEAVEFGHERRTLGACAGNAEVLKAFAEFWKCADSMNSGIQLTCEGYFTMYV